MRIVVDVKNDGNCSARATYHARLDSVKLDAWTNARDATQVSLHTSGDHAVDVDR